jgi:hypothetical protein
MTDIDPDLDLDLVDRLRRNIGHAIVETCRTDEPFVMVKFPECLDALLSVTTAMCGEIALFDNPPETQALADAIGRKIVTDVTAATAARCRQTVSIDALIMAATCKRRCIALMRVGANRTRVIS